MQLYGCKEFHKDGDRGVSYVEVWCSCTAVKSFIRWRSWRLVCGGVVQLYGCKEFHKDGDRGVSYVEVWCSCTAVKSFIKMEIVASRMWRCGAAVRL